VGTCEVQARLSEGAGGAGAGSLVLSTGERFPLGEETLTIGRTPECTIVVGDPNVSRRHAEVRPSGDGFVIVDLGSTNGTKVNGVTITERRLEDGDELALGNTRLRFEAS
jgi:pSer/pThr/pTyr-binding forkhead associated (FHA) protein